MVTIRHFMDPEDRDAVIELYRAAWHAAYDPIDGAHAIDLLLRNLLLGEPPSMFEMAAGDIALVAVVDGRIVGSARAHPRPDGVHLSGMYVTPDLLRHGIGATLLCDLFARFPADALWRADVRPSSEPARYFYASHGFVEKGRGRVDVGGDHWSDMIELIRAASVRPDQSHLPI